MGRWRSGAGGAVPRSSDDVENSNKLAGIGPGGVGGVGKVLPQPTLQAPESANDPAAAKTPVVIDNKSDVVAQVAPLSNHKSLLALVMDFRIRKSVWASVITGINEMKTRIRC